MSTLPRLLSALAFCALASSSSAARADDPAPPDPRTPIVWDPAWARAGAVDYFLTVTGAGLSLGAAIVSPLSKHPRGGILFDEDVRDTLRLSSVQARYTARDTSDVLISLMVTWPFFVDAMITAWWYRKSPEVAYEMAVIDAEAIAIAGAIQGVTNVIVSRERPYARDCDGSIPGTLNDCANSTRFRSFFSGHSELSFTSAALVCSHHLRLDLFGNSGDVASCVTGYVAAAVTATMRVAGDVHYASDAIAGALVGTAVGLGVPAIHYARRSRDPVAAPQTGGLDVNVVPAPNGVNVVGVF